MVKPTDDWRDVGWLAAFIRESNRIEGIVRAPLDREMVAHVVLLDREEILIDDLVAFVDAIQPDARLRDEVGLNVRVGTHIAPEGGQEIRRGLSEILRYAMSGGDPYEVHRRYEYLHPFTDGNGRSGRALWLWQMYKVGRSPALGFLHTWYYQSLQAERHG